MLDSVECNVQRSFYRRHSLSVRRQLLGGTLQQITWLVDALVVDRSLKARTVN